MCEQKNFKKPDVRGLQGITLFTLIHDPHKRKTGYYSLIYIRHMVMLNVPVYAQISVHAGCFLEHLQLYLRNA